MLVECALQGAVARTRQPQGHLRAAVVRVGAGCDQLDAGARGPLAHPDQQVEDRVDHGVHRPRGGAELQLTARLEARTGSGSEPSVEDGGKAGRLRPVATGHGDELDLDADAARAGRRGERAVYGGLQVHARTLARPAPPGIRTATDGGYGTSHAPPAGGILPP